MLQDDKKNLKLSMRVKIILPVIAALQTVLGTTQVCRCYHLLAQTKTVTKEHVPQKISVENKMGKTCMITSFIILTDAPSHIS